MFNYLKIKIDIGRGKYFYINCGKLSIFFIVCYVISEVIFKC